MDKETVKAIAEMADKAGFAVYGISQEGNERYTPISLSIRQKPSAEQVVRKGTIIDLSALEQLRQAAISRNPKLEECAEDSLVGALLMAAHLRLETDDALDQVHLVPSLNEEKKRLECVFKLGDQGLLELKRRLHGN